MSLISKMSKKAKIWLGIAGLIVVSAITSPGSPTQNTNPNTETDGIVQQQEVDQQPEELADVIEKKTEIEVSAVPSKNLPKEIQ